MLQLKKQAKPYKFLKFERKWIYPIVVKGYNEQTDMDLSSQGGKHPLPRRRCVYLCAVLCTDSELGVRKEV